MSSDIYSVSYILYLKWLSGYMHTYIYVRKITGVLLALHHCVEWAVSVRTHRTISGPFTLPNTISSR